MEFKKVPINPRMPHGFRLATFEEFRNFSMLRTQDVLNGKETLRLLDSTVGNGKEISLGDSWPRDIHGKMFMLVVGRSPMPISRNGRFLRKELYSGVELDDGRRKTALRLSYLFGDIEVIYWLLSSENEIKSELKLYFEKNIEKEVTTYHQDFSKIVKILLGSVQIGEDEVAKSLDYAVKVNGVPENVILIAAIVLDYLKERKLPLEDIVDSQIQRVVDMTVENTEEAKRIGVLSKLLSECSDPLKHETKAIRPNFGKILWEATSSGYVPLVSALLGLRDTQVEDELAKSYEDGKTLLHYAVEWEMSEGPGETNLEQVTELLFRFGKEFVMKVDKHGRNPLHLAACQRDEKTVKMILKYVSDPLKRDVAGKTALHHAVTNKKDKDTAKNIVDELLKHLASDHEKRALLLWISATGIGTADQIKGLDQELKDFLKEKKTEICSKVNVLEAAAKSEDSRLTWELLNRGGDISLIQDKSALSFVTQTIEKVSEQATDQPTLIDNLERNVLKECISAHFLNPYIKSPITVSISGGSGSGKSSLMQQIEAYLLVTAAQLAFQDLWMNEKFNGAKTITPSFKGKHMCHRIKKGVYKLLKKDDHRDYKDYIMPLPRKERLEMSLVYFLNTYQPKHKAVYKSLAYMDFNQMMKEDENDSVYDSQGQSLGAVPRILTVNFNVGNYSGRTEAWAGLAVNITKEIESSMTWAQLLSTRWRNAWRRNREDFYIRVIVPGVVLAFVGAWIGWAAWKYLEQSGPSQLQDLKYGSVTATVIVILWSVLGNIVSIFKPISTQMRGYFNSPDYSQQLGYQERVINDIKFLQKEIGEKPFFILSLIAGEMFYNWWGLWKENVEGTCIPQYGSAPEGKLRIIAFVDDLDQCEDTVILEVLWAINLIFRVCEINVVLTMDKATIETAYQKSSVIQDMDFVDKFISKIVQLPVNIPDPTDDEWLKFLDTELVHKKKLGIHSTNKVSKPNTDHVEELHPMAQSEIDRGELETAEKSKDIESGRRSLKCECRCIRLLAWRKEIASWFQFFRHCRNETTDVILDGWKRILEQRMQQVREMLMLSYTDEEAKAFHELKRYGTGFQKLPREWKSYINYHKFARNVVSNMARVKNISYPVGWEVELAVWTFVCSQWKHEMNTLIKDWYKYADDGKDSNGSEAKLKSSLKQIVAYYIEQRKWEEEKGCQLKFTVEEQTGEQARKQIFIASNSTQSSSVGSVQKELERWEKLRECLASFQDVSLESIHYFQNHRYHCDARNLVSKHYKPTKKP